MLSTENDEDGDQTCTSTERFVLDRRGSVEVGASAWQSEQIITIAISMHHPNLRILPIHCMTNVVQCA